MGKINLVSVKNARIIEGYKTCDNRCIKEGRLLRSANLYKIQEEDKNILTDKYNLKVIIDLRAEEEILRKPDECIEGVENIAVKVAEYKSSTAIPAKYGKSDLINNLEGIASYVKKLKPENLYVDIVDSSIGMKAFAKFFDILLENEEGAVLWHCSAGKDRAGLAGVLVMLALGCSLEDAMYEFELSNVAYKDYRENLEKAFKDKMTDSETLDVILTYMAGVSRDYMQRALDLIDSKYGGIDNYLLNQLGLTEEKKQKLRNIYTE